MAKDERKAEEQIRREYFKAVFGKEDFGADKDEQKQIKRALKYAHDIRKFEINLYWQRSLFFWGFSIVLFTFLGFLFASEARFTIAQESTTVVRLISFFVSLLGLFVNWGWIHIERGSKAWQTNWENHINFLEDAVTGSLHKTVLGKKQYFFSVSKITRYIIWAFLVFWLFASFFTAYNLHPDSKARLDSGVAWLTTGHWLPMALILGVCIGGVWLSRSKYWRTRLPGKGAACADNEVNMWKGSLPTKIHSINPRNSK